MTKLERVWQTNEKRDTKMALSTLLERVLELTRTIDEYWDEILPKHYPDYPFADYDTPEPPAPPEEAELVRTIDTASEDDVYGLLVLFYLGRSRLDVDGLSTARDVVRADFPTREAAVEKLSTAASLGGYLEMGLERLETYDIPLESLEVQPQQ